jgi:hypothetical protein
MWHTIIRNQIEPLPNSGTRNRRAELFLIIFAFLNSLLLLILPFSYLGWFPGLACIVPGDQLIYIQRNNPTIFVFEPSEFDDSGRRNLGGVMKKWMLGACMLFLAAAAAAQNGALVPADTILTVQLETTLATFSSRSGDPFQAKLAQDIVINGKTMLPAGAMIEGRVTKVAEPRRISGKPTIGILPEALILPGGERLYLDATLIDTNLPGTEVNNEGEFKGSGHDKRDKLEVGGGTAGGMLIGGLVGGPVGVLVGGMIGAGSTGAHWLSRHRSAVLPAGTELTIELKRPLTTAPAVASAGQ